MFIVFVVLAVLVIAAGAFACGLVIGHGRGEDRATAACDAAHRSRLMSPLPIRTADLGHYEIRPVTTKACAIGIMVADRTEVDAFRAYRELTGKHHRP